MQLRRLYALATVALMAGAPAATRAQGVSGSAGYGADPVTADRAAPQTPGSVGDQQRHYHFEEAGVEMPYRLYVPTDYDPDVPMPLVVALHGYSGTQ